MGQQYDKFEVLAKDVHPWDLLMMGKYADGRPVLLAVKKVELVPCSENRALAEITCGIVGVEELPYMVLKLDGNETVIKAVPTVGD